MLPTTSRYHQQSNPNSQPSILRKTPTKNMFIFVCNYRATPPHPFLKHKLEKNFILYSGKYDNLQNKRASDSIFAQP
jgi:hypothetical protein